MKKRLFLLLFVFIMSGLTHPAKAQLPEKGTFAGVIIRHDKSLDKAKKEKLESLNSYSKILQLRSVDLEEISSCFQNYADSLNENTTTNELLEIIAAQGIYISFPKDHSNQYRHQRKKALENHGLVQAKAHTLLARQGDSMVDLLLKIKAGGFSTNRYTSNAIKIFCEIGSPKAKQALLDIINLKAKRWGTLESRTALYHYLRIIDMEEARQLLSSEDDEVFKRTLKKFPELAIEAKYFDRISGFLKSDNHHDRWWAIGMFRRFPPTEKVPQRVSIVAESLKTVHQLPKADERYMHMALGTYSDNLYSELCRFLAGLSNADNALANVTKDMAGLARKWIIVTRAYRGDASLKEEVISILKDQSVLERTSLRNGAIRALGIIGTPDDIAFLKNIEENDPLNCLNGGGPLLERINDRPINNTGKNAVVVYHEIIDYDPWEKFEADKTYPIRYAAKRAIKQIEGRQ